MDDYDVFINTVLNEALRRCREPIDEIGCAAIRETAAGYKTIELFPDDDAVDAFPLPWLSAISPTPRHVQFQDSDIDRRLGWHPQLDSAFEAEVTMRVREAWRDYSRSGLHLRDEADADEELADEAVEVIGECRHDRSLAALLQEIGERVTTPDVEMEADEVAEAVDAADNVLATAQQIHAQVEAGAIAWVRKHGLIRFGDEELRCVLDQRWHPRDHACALAVVVRSGGFPAPADCAMFIHLRMNVVRQVIGDDTFEAHFFAVGADGVREFDEVLRRQRSGTSGRTTSRAFPPRRRD